MVHKKLFRQKKKIDYTNAWYRLTHFVIVQNDIKKTTFWLVFIQNSFSSMFPLRSTSSFCTALRPDSSWLCLYFHVNTYSIPVNYICMSCLIMWLSKDITIMWLRQSSNWYRSAWMSFTAHETGKKRSKCSNWFSTSTASLERFSSKSKYPPCK